MFFFSPAKHQHFTSVFKEIPCLYYPDSKQHILQGAASIGDLPWGPLNVSLQFKRKKENHSFASLSVRKQTRPCLTVQKCLNEDIFHLRGLRFNTVYWINCILFIKIIFSWVWCIFRPLLSKTGPFDPWVRTRMRSGLKPGTSVTSLHNDRLVYYSKYDWNNIHKWYFSFSWCIQFFSTDIWKVLFKPEAKSIVQHTAFIYHTPCQGREAAGV